jgi:hypothetical protein
MFACTVLNKADAGQITDQNTNGSDVILKQKAQARILVRANSEHTHFGRTAS